MRIQILGTGAAEGYPALFCECFNCRSARASGGKNLRSRLSIRVDEDLLVDIPPDLLSQAHRGGFSLAKVRHVLITHSHRDHFTPSELVWRDEPFAVWTEKPPIYVYGLPSVGETLRRNLDTDPTEHGIQFRTIRPFVPFTADPYDVTPLEANHAHDRGALNYILSKGRRKVLLAFDTGWYRDRSWEALGGWQFDVVIMECTNGLLDDPDAEHLSVEGVRRMRAELLRRECIGKSTLFLAVHFSHNGCPLHEELERLLEPHGIRPAYDGLTVDIPEHNR